MNVNIKFLVLIFLFCSCISKLPSNGNELSINTVHDTLVPNDKFEDSNRNRNFYTDSIKQEIKKSLSLTEVYYLGEIASGKFKWYIVKGFIDGGTFQDFSLYLVPNFKTNIPDSILKQKYSIPGKEYSFDNELIFKSRVFVGHCTEKYDQSVIWYQYEKCEKKWINSCYVIQIQDDTLKSFRFGKGEINLNEILKNVKEKKCFELEGIDTYEEP